MADVHYPQQHQLGGGTQRYNYQLGGGTQHYNRQYSRTQRYNQVVKAATAATAGGSLLLLSGITLAGTVITLTVATPLLVIFSPILVPGVITIFLLASGFLTSGGLGVAAMTVLSWLYRYVTGGNPPGSDSVDQATDKMGSKVRDVKNRADQACWEARDRADQASWEARDRAEGAGWDDTHQDEPNWEPYRRQQQSNAQLYSQVVKAATAATAGGSLVVLSGLTLAGTVIALTVATPLLVIFSPVLVPAVISVFLLATGFFTSGGFGISAVTVLTWLYRYVTGGNPSGSNSLDQASDKLGSKARDVRDRAENVGREIWNRAECARDRTDYAGRETKDRADHVAGGGTHRIA